MISSSSWARSLSPALASLPASFLAYAVKWIFHITSQVLCRSLQALSAVLDVLIHASPVWRLDTAFR